MEKLPAGNAAESALHGELADFDWPMNAISWNTVNMPTRQTRMNAPLTRESARTQNIMYTSIIIPAQCSKLIIRSCIEALHVLTRTLKLCMSCMEHFDPPSFKSSSVNAPLHSFGLDITPLKRKITIMFYMYVQRCCLPFLARKNYDSLFLAISQSLALPCC
eukprot:scpid100126/ scgid15054/ 